MVVQMNCCQQHNVATGALQFQVDAAGNVVNDTSGNPILLMEDCVQEVGNLFDIWHNLNKMEFLRVATSAINMPRMSIVKILSC